MPPALWTLFPLRLFACLPAAVYFLSLVALVLLISMYDRHRQSATCRYFLLKFSWNFGAVKSRKSRLKFAYVKCDISKLIRVIKNVSTTTAPRAFEGGWAIRSYEHRVLNWYEFWLSCQRDEIVVNKFCAKKFLCFFSLKASFDDKLWDVRSFVIRFLTSRIFALLSISLSAIFIYKAWRERNSSFEISVSDFLLETCDENL